MISLNELVLATHNPGKIPELAAILDTQQVLQVAKLSTAHSHGVTEPQETESSFIGNAKLKALHTYRHTGLASFADDSGLCVDILEGAPGIHSARWAENAAGERDFAQAMARLEAACRAKGDPPYRAHFACALVLVLPPANTDAPPQLIIGEGHTHGTLRFPPEGEGGFGYDPVFVPQDHTMSFATMPASQKDSLSHRARAFDALLAQLEITMRQIAFPPQSPAPPPSPQ